MNSGSCDFCNESRAVLYCRADSAKLCFTCDREVHSTNQLFQKHNRCLLCNSCNSGPSSIFCCTESAVLCQNCDWETHNKSFGTVHDRRPVEGFNGCPSVGELVNLFGFDDFGKKQESDDEDDLFDNNNNMFVWEENSVAGVSFDDLLLSSSTDVCNNNINKAMGVPPLPKNRNAACGEHKEEILSQLREMAKIESKFTASLKDLEPNFDYPHQVHEKFQLRETSPGFETNPEPVSVPSYETTVVKLCDYTGGIPDQVFSSSLFGGFSDMNHLVPDKDSDVTDAADGLQEVQTCIPEDSKILLVNPKAGIWELNTQERDSAISRYKEKRKSRRYDKHIRYESRKVRAESRTRVKGRFAKMDQ